MCDCKKKKHHHKCHKVEKARSFHFRCSCISRDYQLDFSNVRELCPPSLCQDDLCFCC